MLNSVADGGGTVLAGAACDADVVEAAGDNEGNNGGFLVRAGCCGDDCCGSGGSGRLSESLVPAVPRVLLLESLPGFWLWLSALRALSNAR